MYTSSQITDLALSIVRKRRDKMLGVLVFLAVTDAVILGWLIGVLMLFPIAMTYFGSEYGVELGRKWESTLLQRELCYCFAVVAAVLVVVTAYFVVPTDDTVMRVLTGFAFAMAIMSIVNALLMTSKFTHLTDSDVQEVNNHDTRLLHPMW